MMNQDGFGVFNWDDLHATMNRICVDKALQEQQYRIMGTAMQFNGETVSFSKYGKTFQEKLCMVILDDRPFADQIAEVLDINFLELSYLRTFVKKVFGQREKYNVHPSYKIMTTVLRSELEDESETDKQQVRTYFARIYNGDVEGLSLIHI